MKNIRNIVLFGLLFNLMLSYGNNIQYQQKFYKLQTIIQNENSTSDYYIKKLNMPLIAKFVSIENLSGGNQQKAIISRLLFCDADVFILDEPTQGIDIGAKVEVYNIINELTRKGKSILLISSDFPELLAMSDRIAVVHQGQITNVQSARDMDIHGLIESVISKDSRNKIIKDIK